MKSPNFKNGKVNARACKDCIKSRINALETALDGSRRQNDSFHISPLINNREVAWPTWLQVTLKKKYEITTYKLWGLQEIVLCRSYKLHPPVKGPLVRKVVRRCDILGPYRGSLLTSLVNGLTLTFALVGGCRTDPPPLSFSKITRAKSCCSRRNFQYPRVNQYYAYP